MVNWNQTSCFGACPMLTPMYAASPEPHALQTESEPGHAGRAWMITNM